MKSKYHTSHFIFPLSNQSSKNKHRKYKKSSFKQQLYWRRQWDEFGKDQAELSEQVDGCSSGINSPPTVLLYWFDCHDKKWQYVVITRTPWNIRRWNLKNVHPWQIFTPIFLKLFIPENYSLLKIFTPEKYSPLKNINPWKIFTPEKYLPLKNIYPWKIFTPKNA